MSGPHARSPERFLRDLNWSVHLLEGRQGAVIPARLGAQGQMVTDWNAAGSAGFYWSEDTALNNPFDGPAAGIVRVSGDTIVQDVVDPSTDALITMRRVYDGATWGDWAAVGAPPLPSPASMYRNLTHTVTNTTGWGTAIPDTQIEFEVSHPLRVLVVAGGWIGNTGGLTRVGVAASGALTLTPPDPGWGMVMMTSDLVGSQQRSVQTYLDLPAGTTTFELQAYRSGSAGNANYVVLQIIPVSWIGTPGTVSSGESVAWGAITGKPSTFPPSAHSHLIGDLPVAASGVSSSTDLVRADDSRLSNARTPTAHSHPTSDITGFAAAALAAVPNASVTNHGIAELATAAEVQALSDTGRTITPAGLATLTPTDTRLGLIELATVAEAQAGTDTERAITPHTLRQTTASNTRYGVAEIATQVEVDDGTDPGRIVSPLALKGAKGIVRGDDGRKYRVLGGTIRNTGSGFAWINDASHEPIGFNTTITTNADSVEINYGFTAAQVISLVCTPDDGFAKLGYSFGASVGLSSAIIQAGITDGWHDYVTYDTGTASWVSLTGFITSVSYNGTTGLITFNHADVGTKYQYAGQISLRGGPYRMSQEGMSATSMSAYVYAYNSAITQKSPGNAEKFWIYRPGARVVPMSELVQSGTNIWVQGLMEVA